MSVRLISEERVRGWEQRLRTAMDNATRDQLAPARRELALTAAGGKAKTAALGGTALLGLWSQAQWQKYLATYLEPEVTSIESEAARLSADALGGTAAWGFASSGAMTAAVMSRATTTGAWIGDRLVEAGTAPDAASAVQGVLATAGDILGLQIAAMAQAIANSTSNDLMAYAQTGDPINYADATHTWNSMNDDRTREAHADADGQEQPVGTPFDVMGEQLMYPGDPDGSDENTINCRCWEEVSGSAMEQPTAIEDYTGTPAYASPAG